NVCIRPLLGRLTLAPFARHSPPRGVGMNKVATVGALAITLGWPQGASAQTDIGSGNYMLDVCDEDHRVNVESGFCLGRIDGFSSVYQLLNYDSETAAICRPHGSTTGQARDVFVAYLRKHPESRHLDW